METRRALLSALEDGPVSGPALADRLGISRAAVWKAVETLREEGLDVESTDDGYVVRDSPGFSAAGIEFGLDAPYRIEYHDAIGSTNDRARDLAGDGERDVCVVADEQTGSRGRLDREWTAPSGGIYLSIVCEPNLSPAHAPIVTLAAAVATTEACREAGVDATIKWPNDVLVGTSGSGEGASTRDRGGRKIAGVLTEMEGEADRVSWIVPGIGVNANVDLSVLPAGSTSLRAETGGDVDRRRFTQRLLETFHGLLADPDRILDRWRRYAVTLGQRVRVETPGGTVVGDAVDVEFPGALVVDTDEGRRRVHAGDCEHLRPIEE